MGICLFLLADGANVFWSISIHASTLEVWRTEGGIEQIVTHAEITFVAIHLCSRCALLKDRDIISFVDNEASKHSFIGGWPNNEACGLLPHEAKIVAAKLCARFMYERVLSLWNPADDPLRHVIDGLSGKGFRQSQAVMPPSVSWSYASYVLFPN